MYAAAEILSCANKTKPSQCIFSFSFFFFLNHRIALYLLCIYAITFVLKLTLCERRNLEMNRRRAFQVLYAAVGIL